MLRQSLLSAALISAAALISSETYAAPQDNGQTEVDVQSVFSGHVRREEVELTPEEMKAMEKEKARQERLAKRRAVITGEEAERARKEREKANPSLRGKKKDEPKAPVYEHEYLEPSTQFTLFFRPWRLKVGRISFLQNTVKDLIRHHPGCRVVPAETKTASDIVACPDTREFGADGDEVVFEFLKSNDVLSGGEYYFRDPKRATAFARLIVREIETANKTFTDASGSLIDSPLFKVAVQEAEGAGAWVRISLNFEEEVDDFETYGRLKLGYLDFGSLSVGKTRRDEINVTPNPNAKSSCAKTNGPNADMDEYYGECFEFPYESHYQLNFEPQADLLQYVALTPLGVLSGNLVESALIKKYGEPQYCDRITSDVSLVRTNRTKKYHVTQKMDRANGHKATVFAGNCEKPVVFAIDDRYVFLFDRISPYMIEQDFLRRRAENETVKENKRELDKRRNQLSKFF